jgi:hypothetical protein
VEHAFTVDRLPALVCLLGVLQLRHALIRVNVLRWPAGFTAQEIVPRTSHLCGYAIKPSRLLPAATGIGALVLQQLEVASRSFVIVVIPFVFFCGWYPVARVSSLPHS